jgi:hypothetical protein
MSNNPPKAAAKITVPLLGTASVDLGAEVEAKMAVNRSRRYERRPNGPSVRDAD